VCNLIGNGETLERERRFSGARRLRRELPVQSLQLAEPSLRVGSEAMKRSKARVVTQNPGGTATPAARDGQMALSLPPGQNPRIDFGERRVSAAGSIGLSVATLSF